MEGPKSPTWWETCPCNVFLSPTPIKGLFPPGPAYWKGWVFHPGLGRRGGVLRLTSSSMVVSSEAGKDLTLAGDQSATAARLASNDPV